MSWIALVCLLGLSTAQGADPSEGRLPLRSPGGACLPRLAEGGGGCCGGGLIAGAAALTLTLTWGRFASRGAGASTLPVYYGTMVMVWSASAAWGVHAIGEWMRTGRPGIAPRGESFERTLLFSLAGTALGIAAAEARLYATSGSLTHYRSGNGSWIVAVPFVSVAFSIFGYETSPK